MQPSTDAGNSAAAPLSLTVLICTHERRALLERTFASLNAARRPDGAAVEILVVANACRDDTPAWLEDYRREPGARLPLRWIEEPAPGKSNALNRAFRAPLGEVIAFVDDDHRVDPGYLEAVAAAARAHPEAGMFCGRILPDWDGREPAWVHDEGPYRIYPLPVPRFDLGDEPRELHHDGSVPGGGNLSARREVIHATGSFATDLGPTGHDLGGAEDLDWVRRAMRAGARLRYVPGIVQHHYVDLERLTPSYLARKAFQRSKSVIRLDRRRAVVPPYMWRKLAQYAASWCLAFNGARRRFYRVRLFAAMGEVAGLLANRRDARRRARLPRLAGDGRRPAWLVAAIAGAAAALMLAPAGIARAGIPVSVTAALAALAVLAKSLRDFSLSGPRLREQILRRYRGYAAYAVIRLGLWMWVIWMFFGAAGAIAFSAIAAALGITFETSGVVVGALAGIAIATAVQATHSLVRNPGLVVASWPYRLSRLTAARKWLIAHAAPRVLPLAGWLGAALVAAALAALAARGETAAAAAALTALAAQGAFVRWAGWEVEPRPQRRKRPSSRPNIVMIGSDTLRADRVLDPSYPRRLTPNIERLAARASFFPNCYVPCARTAPSLISLLSGTWPHTHGVRDNFVAGADTRLPVRMLPERLREAGYRTAAASDWCGADFAKFSFGFDVADVPADQWNLKYFLRQGPKDLRLLLSLFCHNEFGRAVLPEIHYLGGVPQTDPLGRRTRALMSRLAAGEQPFLLNVFFSTTHPPFASEAPYFERFADPGYAGESAFAMARLNDPFDIIRRQGEARSEFDLDQILALYDGCVSRFDAEVGRLMAHLEACGLAQDTLVVLYSDHGMEFFEHGTWGQGNSAIAEASPRVPLLIADPRTPRPNRCEAVVRSVDIAPTLADLAGIEYAGPEGVSLRALIEGAAAETDLPAFNETGIWITEMPGQPAGHLRYPDLFELLEVADGAGGSLGVKPAYRERVVSAKDRMIRRGDWKLVYQPLDAGALLSLFDLARDPGCTRDVREQHPEIAARLWRELSQWLAADRAVAARQVQANEALHEGATAVAPKTA